MKARHHSYWLMPCPDDHSLLQGIIKELAHRYDTPVFPPHLTLFAGPASPEGEASQILHTLQEKQIPESLVITGLDATTRYTMTLFLRCQPVPELFALHDLIGKQAPPSEYLLDPHLSLLYADLPLSTKQGLAHELALPLRKLRFDRIRFVGHPSPVESQEDIADFQDIAEREFHQDS